MGNVELNAGQIYIAIVLSTETKGVLSAFEEGITPFCLFWLVTLEAELKD